MTTRWRITVPVEVTIQVSDEFDRLFQDPFELDQHAEWLYDKACDAIPSHRPMTFAALYGEDPAEIIGSVTSINVDYDDYSYQVKIKELRPR